MSWTLTHRKVKQDTGWAPGVFVLEPLQLAEIRHTCCHGCDALQQPQPVFAQGAVLGHDQHVVEEFGDGRDHGKQRGEEVVNGWGSGCVNGGSGYVLIRSVEVFLRWFR